MNAPNDFDPFEDANRRAAEASELPEWLDHEPPAEDSVKPILRAVPASTFATAVTESGGLVSSPRAEGSPGRLIKPTAEKLFESVANFMEYEVAYDEFAGQLMRRRRGAGLEWERWTDNHLTAMRVEFDRCGFATPPKDLMRDVVRLVAHGNSFDSAIEWANSLKWDGVGRIATFAHVYLKAPLNAYTQAVSHYLWTGLAGRLMVPGCQCDYVPVFVSKAEGLKKTTMVSLLAPSPEFAGSIRMDMAPDDLSRKMRGKLVLEWAEMQGLKTRDEEAIKDFVTQRVEEWVEKYETHTTRYPRRNMLIGTSNDMRLLPSYGDGRRWFPLALSQQIDADAVVRDRDQLWAEAIHTFRHFGVLWQDANELAKSVREQFREEDARLVTVQRWLEQTSISHQFSNGDRPFATADVQGALKAAGHRKYDDKTLSSLLESMGYESGRVRVEAGGNAVWRWHKRVTCVTQKVEGDTEGDTAETLVA
ncbi:VapE domain-containing protein [Paraburkholderia sediminicola]|uniref:VapE domain-containing protein n=1 Tax=Paraburkholderia sediminicola TaxID=458836 RepID=UPI0038B88F94